jgi:hypothetical protein
MEDGFLMMGGIMAHGGTTADDDIDWYTMATEYYGYDFIDLSADEKDEAIAELKKDYYKGKMSKGGGVSKTEYIVWGVPPNKKYEEPLITDAKSLKVAENYCKLLTEKYGCKNCRIQVLDLSGNVNFSKMFSDTINQNPKKKNSKRED